MSKLQIKISPYLERLIDEVRKISGESKTAVIERLLYQIELHARNGQLPKAIGLDIIEAASTLNNQGYGAKHLDPVHLAGGEHVRFDVALLERTGRSKTGFAGINATSGSSFRALVPDVDNGGSRYLASRPTAVQAAIDRYQWFEQHGLPYGNVGWHIEEARKIYPSKSTEELLIELRDFVAAGHVHGLKNPVSLDEVEKTLANYRRAKGIEAPIVVEDERPRMKPVPDVVICVVCKSEIGDGEPFSPRGKEDYAHQSCLDS